MDRLKHEKSLGHLFHSKSLSSVPVSRPALESSPLLSQVFCMGQPSPEFSEHTCGPISGGISRTGSLSTKEAGARSGSPTMRFLRQRLVNYSGLAPNRDPADVCFLSS
jgi:hypothetical protein